MTEKLYYTDSFLKEFTGTVLSSKPGKEKDTWDVVLDRTAFYPEGGGQPCDFGTLGETKVIAVHEKDDVIVHSCSAPLKEGGVVQGIIDWNRRFDHMQQHSGEHIVSGMLCSEFHCDNVGFHMGADEVTIDYNTDISWDDIIEVESRANTYIWENHPFIEQWPTKEELKTMNYRSKKELEGAVRITAFPGADCCACCGTHVKESGQVGLVKFLRVDKFREGVRIQVLFGKRAFDYLNENCNQNQNIASEMSTHGSKTFASFMKMKKDLLDIRTKLSSVENELFEVIAEEYRGKENVCIIREGLSGDSLRHFADTVSEVVKGTCAVFSETKDNASEGENPNGAEHRFNYVLVNKNDDIQSLVKDINRELTGRGGGKKGFAQGSAVTSKLMINEFFNRFFDNRN